MEKIRQNIKAFFPGVIISAIFIFFSFMSFNFFESIERFLYGIEMRLALAPSSGIGNIAIVNIDEKSIDRIGSWPWPRSYLADMINILKDNGARFIGLDLELNEKEQNQGLEEVRKLYNEISGQAGSAEREKSLLERLNEIELKLDNDRKLENSLAQAGNVVLPVKGSHGETETIFVDNNILDKNSVQLKGPGINSDAFFSVNRLTVPYTKLAENSLGLGHINQSANRSMAGRTHLMFLDFRGNIIPSMPLKLAMDYMGMDTGNILASKGIIKISNLSIPSIKGEALIRFRGGKRSFPYYSFVDIHKVRKVPAVFDGKIVLIGRTAAGGETINTPVDQKMPRVEFTANVVEDLLRGRFIRRPAVMALIEAIILLVLTLFFSFYITSTSQINRVLITGSAIILIIFAGVLFFVVLDTWIKTVYICLAILVLYVTITIRDIAASQKLLGIRSEEFMESNRMLGLSFQSQGLLDLAFEKFRKCPLDNAMKDVIYNLGLDYERKRMLNKAISVYEYIAQNDIKFRDLDDRISKLRDAIGAPAAAGKKGRKEQKIVVVDDLEIKPTVGRYEIIREIGQGAMGIVYEANDPKINRRLAIKTIRFSDEFEESRIKQIKSRFFREAEIAGKLSHPSIVSIYDAGEEYDLTYLAMEYLEGEDLRKYCKMESILPLRKILGITSDVALALDYAHTQGVIHRDIKPGNIMLLKNGKVKVTDFGIAKAISSTETKSGVILGTPNYMSPEQINGQKIDGRSDLFALGVVLFELLTGQVPFHGKNITNLLYQITQVKHPSIRALNPKVPKAIEQIINKTLEKNPDDRFPRGMDIAKYLNIMINKMDTATKSL